MFSKYFSLMCIFCMKCCLWSISDMFLSVIDRFGGCGTCFFDMLNYFHFVFCCLGIWSISDMFVLVMDLRNV